MAEPIKNLAWDDFWLVNAIADARSLPGAAVLLGINHSTVFRRLGQIEEALGVTLFERHRSGYALTPAGEAMVALAQQINENITSFTRKIAGQEIAPAGELRVTTNDSLLIHLLTPLFVDFRRQCREVRLDVVLANQALNLSKRDADVAIRTTDKPPENLVGRRVATIAWALYGRASEFPDPGTIDPGSLFERDWVSLADNLAGAALGRDRTRSGRQQEPAGEPVGAGARAAGAHCLQGEHGTRTGRGRRGGARSRPPPMLHRR